MCIKICIYLYYQNETIILKFKAMTTNLNTSDFKNYGFSSKPIFLCLKEFANGYKEAIATYKRWNGQFFTVRNKIN